MVESKRREAVVHLRFVIGLYKIQIDAGRHFLHEHPETATSLKDPMMEKLLREKQALTTVSDQCEYGLSTPGPNGGPLPAKKPTKWASSSCHMLKCISRRCKRDHTHQQLLGGRAKQAENYPLDLIVEIIMGMRDAADFEEDWGDETEGGIAQSMIASSMFHSPKYSSLVAGYRAKDREGRQSTCLSSASLKMGRSRNPC